MNDLMNFKLNYFLSNVEITGIGAYYITTLSYQKQKRQNNLKG